MLLSAADMAGCIGNAPSSCSAALAEVHSLLALVTASAASSWARGSCSAATAAAGHAMSVVKWSGSCCMYGCQKEEEPLAASNRRCMARICSVWLHQKHPHTLAALEHYWPAAWTLTTSCDQRLRSCSNIIALHSMHSSRLRRCYLVQMKELRYELCIIVSDQNWIADTAVPHVGVILHT